MSQGELFPLPPGVRPVPAQRTEYRASGNICYRHYHSRAARACDRRLCDHCVTLIHQFGQQHAPYPFPARWMRIDGAHVIYLCHAHVHQWQEADQL